MNAAVALRFVEGDDHAFTFSHEIIRAYFVKASSKDKIGVQTKYSECLLILRPHDYFARCLSLVAAQEFDAAAITYSQGVIAEWRSGRDDISIVEADLLHLVKLAIEQRHFLTAVYDLYELLSRGDFRQAQLRLALAERAPWKNLFRRARLRIGRGIIEGPRHFKVRRGPIHSC